MKTNSIMNVKLDKAIESLWLKSAVKDCYIRLEKSKDADAFETYSGTLLSGDEKEEYQVQIKVTRKKDDFLGDFDFVEHKTYKGK